MRRRVIASDAFDDSLAALDDSEETMDAVKALLLRVTSHPECGPALPGLEIRILKTGGHPGFTPLRLFYAFDATTTYLLQIERYVPIE